MNDTSGPGSAIVYTPRGWSGARIGFPSVVLLVICVLLLASSIATGSVAGVVTTAAFALLPLWGLTTLRKRVTLTETDLVVQGRFARVVVPLHLITAIHRQDRRTLLVWVAAVGVQPFRICFLTGHPTFVADVRARAAALGAVLDTEADPVEPPPGTRVLFTAL